MAVIFRRRGNIKNRLIKNQVDEALRNRRCPKCKAICVEVETEKDKITLFCPRCRAAIDFNNMIVDGIPRKNETQVGLFTLRDKSSPETSTPAAPAEPALTEGMKETIKAIREAVKDLKLIKFSYVSKDKKTTERTVEVYKLTFDGSKTPVLYGYCLDQENIRLFKLASISKVTMLDMTYKPRWPVEDLIKEKPDDEGA